MPNRCTIRNASSRARIRVFAGMLSVYSRARGTEACSHTEESAGIKMLYDLSMGLLEQIGIRFG